MLKIHKIYTDITFINIHSGFHTESTADKNVYTNGGCIKAKKKTIRLLELKWLLKIYTSPHMSSHSC